jgi:hypothetical protein
MASGLLETGAQESAHLFFHPDYTVDPGIAPDPAPQRSWVMTTDRELGRCPSPCPEDLF